MYGWLLWAHASLPRCARASTSRLSCLLNSWISTTMTPWPRRYAAAFICGAGELEYTYNWFTTRATGDWQPGESFHQKSGAYRVGGCLRQRRGVEVYPTAPSACRCEANFFGRPFAILSEFEKTISCIERGDKTATRGHSPAQRPESRRGGAAPEAVRAEPPCARSARRCNPGIYQNRRGPDGSNAVRRRGGLLRAGR